MNSKGSKLIRILVVFFLAISLYLFFLNLFSEKKSPNLNKNQNLKMTVENSLDGTQGTYAIAIKNLKTGESYYNNEHQSFEAGSLYKLWIMAEAFKQIEEGKIKEDEDLNADIADLNDEFNIASGEAELNTGSISLTTASALNQMITISHNYAALLLTQKIKLSTVARFLKNEGFNKSSVGSDGSPPKSSAADILSFYKKLYEGEIAGGENTQKMIDLLKKQQLNDGLPKYLPQEAQVAHKTGDIGWFKHDGGIIFSEKGDYIIVVMSESNSPPGAQERIALLSKAVYDYFSRL